MLRLFLITFCLCIGFTSINAIAQTTNKSAWTAEEETEMQNAFYENSKQLLKEDAQRKQWAGCLIKKIEEAFPGGSSSATQDSMMRAANLAGRACTEAITNPVFVWSPMLIEKTKESLLAKLSTLATLKSYSAVAKQHLVDCMMTKFRLKYPDGFSMVMLEQITNQSAKDCVIEIRTKKP